MADLHRLPHEIGVAFAGAGVGAAALVIPTADTNPRAFIGRTGFLDNRGLLAKLNAVIVTRICRALYAARHPSVVGVGDIGYRIQRGNEAERGHFAELDAAFIPIGVGVGAVVVAGRQSAAVAAHPVGHIICAQR